MLLTELADDEAAAFLPVARNSERVQNGPFKALRFRVPGGLQVFFRLRVEGFGALEDVVFRVWCSRDLPAVSLCAWLL